MKTVTDLRFMVGPYKCSS